VADIQEVTARVNAARAVCTVPPVMELPKGERGNPCFCPLGRAFRKGMSDTFFLAVGTNHLRLGSADANVSDIARRIQKVWGMEESKVKREGKQFLVLPLPPELTQFVMQFDAGKLPEFEGEIEAAEKVRFDRLSRRLWNLTMEGLERLRGVNHQSI